MSRLRTCIVCHDSRPTSDFNIEHVFPFALGGNLTTEAVCKPCNERLGRTADAPLCQDWLVSSKRMLHRISGRSGRVPNPMSHLALADDPEQRVHWTPGYDGEPATIRLVPKAPTVERDGDILRISVSGDARDREEILAGVRRKLRRMGLSDKVSDAELQSLVAESETINPRVTGQVRIWMDAFVPAVLKIAYEVGATVLGQHCDLSVDKKAERLRQALLADSFEGIGHPMTHFGVEGSAVHWATAREDPIADVVGFLEPDPERHVAVVFHLGNSIRVGVRIFDTYWGLIEVADGSAVPQFAPVGVSLDWKSRTHRRISILDRVDECMRAGDFRPADRFLQAMDVRRRAAEEP